MYTIDASVWVNGFDQREPGHQITRQLLDVIAARRLIVVVPDLAFVEVAGAISRTRHDPQQAEAFALNMSRLPNVTSVILEAALVRQAVALAAQYGVRGADAVYAAVALQAGCTLVTLDNEQLARLAAVLPTRTPEQAIAAMPRPSEEK